ncbi:MAG: hypothetical protein V7L14_02735 [Nostoc sp.]|uniref:hypothetical protein n=1 Tax=Nostoc sp. TaxID=1180 RepID=UPI002FFCC44E
MTLISETTPVRTVDEFLLLVDVNMLIEITKAKEYSSLLILQNNLSISIEEGIEIFIIPGFVEIRKMIQRVPELLKGEKLKHINYDAKLACASLTFLIVKRNEEIENIKKQIVDPRAIAGLSFTQRVYTDIIEALVHFIPKTK